MIIDPHRRGRSSLASMPRWHQLALTTAVLWALCSPSAAWAQCAADTDCRYGRVCRDGQCTYPEGTCQRDVDCPERSICEQGRCVPLLAEPQAPARPTGPLLEPPRPSALRGLRARRTDGGSRFVDPIEWGGRGSISPRPHGTSVFEFQYGLGEIPFSCVTGEDQADVNSMQLTLGGDSVIADIVDIGFTMALFRWVGPEGCASQTTIGDVQMRLSVLAYRSSGTRHWFGLTPFLRLLLSPTSSGSFTGSYYALFEPGVAIGGNVGIFSASAHLSGIVGLTDDDALGMFLSHISIGLRPVDILAAIIDLEVGYGTPAERSSVPVAAMLGIRLFLGSMLALDISTRIAITEAARYSDSNAAVGFWSIGTRLSIVWRGLGRP